MKWQHQPWFRSAVPKAAFPTFIKLRVESTAFIFSWATRGQRLGRGDVVEKREAGVTSPQSSTSTPGGRHIYGLFRVFRG
jgi:hypothetical protein